MDQQNDNLLTKLSVRLFNVKSEITTGSGVIYSHPKLNQIIYILTAAHCLFEDQDSFLRPLEEIGVDFFNESKKSYDSLVHKINFNLFWTDVDNDVAILVLNLDEVETITGKLPVVKVVLNRNNHTHFVAKGFPSATDGKEIVSISPTWSQQLPENNKFQLHISQDFSDAYSVTYRVDGFSGAGIFLYDHQQIYLYGIFTRFLDAGKIIYCQPLKKFETLLNLNYLPSLSYTFFGSYGISSEFFHNNERRSITELGPRFNSKLNFQLPIASYFNAITKDNSFRQLLTKIVDRLLSESVYGGAEIDEIKENYIEVNNSIKIWFETISWQLCDQIVIDEIIERINFFEEAAEQKRSDLYNRRYELAEKVQGILEENYREAYSKEISNLSSMIRNFSNFRQELANIHLSLSNYPVLLMKGNAGAGKSHLLGDILCQRNENELPTILLLGQLFVPGKSLWENVLHQLGLTCTQQEFLSTLNSIGEQIGTRVLLMVDAINEGAGKSLWNNGLAGFIHDCSEYCAIGLVISIRTTYWKNIIPESVKDDERITIVEHHGFKGSEYEAVKLFCEFYEIKQPNFPLLNPEYSNPLFLHLICKGIQSTSEKIFPQGFQGVTKVFSYYLKAVENRLIQKRDNYDYAPNLLVLALNSFAKRCFEKNRRSILLVEALELFQKEFSGYPNLLGDLIEESVLIRSLPSRYNWNEDDEEEIIYFAYERFGDFYFAAELIKDIQNKEVALQKFERNEVLGMLMENGGWPNSGILEALSVLLPEKFDLEIFEAYHWVFINEEEYFNVSNHNISNWYLMSLKWRKPASIDYEKFKIWAQTSDQFRISDHEYFNFLYEMCAVDGHPFNSDRMTEMFFRETMANRDSFLQEYFYYYGGDDDSGVALPIKRLIDWAWRPNISIETSHSSAKLVGQALFWVLSSTDNSLRDQATKALVNLLQDQIPALIELFNRFYEIDDIYITERIGAVAYGCALRSKDNTDLKILTQTVYNNIFREGTPPKHLLLRDYCRHIIEFSLYKELDLDLSKATFRPPYKTTLPEEYPTKDELKIYEEGKDDEGEAGRVARANSRVIFSVLSWDFGRYTIDSAIRSFEIIPFRFEEDIERFKSGLYRGGKSKLVLLNKMYSRYNTPKEKRKRFSIGNENFSDRFWNAVDELWEKVEGDFLMKLDESQQSFYQEKILPYWNLVFKNKNDRDLDLDKGKIKNWIVQRVFNLGYDGKIHGNFDNNRESYGRSEGAKVERIGKKYQWIAFYEMLGILSDNYKIRDEYTTNKKSWTYNGPWDLTYRDIDPSFTTKRNQEKYDEEDFGLLGKEKEWYFPPNYMHWNNLQPDWPDTVADLPNPIENIQRTDLNGVEWVYLFSSNIWKAPKNIGESSLGAGRKEIWYMLQGFLVQNAKYQRTLDWLHKQEFHGHWLPQAYEVSNLLARECYWSPLSTQYQKEHGVWRTINNNRLKVMLPTNQAIGSLDKDNSGAHFHYQIPNKEIFEKLDLRYADLDGEFQNDEGEILFTNISPLGCMI